MADGKETEQGEPILDEKAREAIDNPTGKVAQLRSDLKFALMLSPERREKLIQEVFEGRTEEVYLVIEKATSEEDLTPEDKVLLAEVRTALGVKETSAQKQTNWRGQAEQGIKKDDTDKINR